MQTTLTLDDELVEELTEVAHRAGKPFTDVVNETLRKGLHPAGALSPKPYRLETFALGVLPGVDMDKARHISDALEDEEILRKLRWGNDPGRCECTHLRDQRLRFSSPREHFVVAASAATNVVHAR
jgi:hypothetical protein